MSDRTREFTQRESREDKQRIALDSEIREIAKDLQDRLNEEAEEPTEERLAREQELLTKLIAKPADSRFTEGNIIKAIRLLRAIRNPKRANKRPVFSSDQDKVMAYELVVRIIKYTSPLADALEASEYYWKFPTEEIDRDYVIAIAYDLLERGFKLDKSQKFRGRFGEMQENLISLRTKIMAQLARLRIKYEAMGMDGLIPEKLRHQSRVDQNPLYAWVNLVKTTVDEVLRQLVTLGLTSCTDQDDVLIQENSFFLFKYHGNLIRFHSSRFDFLKKSELVKSCSLIMQDKSDCLPIYTMAKSLFFKEHLIRGTHRPNGILDPRTIAQYSTPTTTPTPAAPPSWYDGILSDSKSSNSDSVIITHCGAGFQVAHMAVHLQCSVPQYLTKQAESTGKEDLITFSNKKFHRRPPLNVIAFGVQEHKVHEITHFLRKKVGITNIKLYQESFTKVDPEDSRVRGAIAIMVNPPSSGSALKDPVKYLCSEGGDEEILTHMSKYISHQETVNVDVSVGSFKADQAAFFEHALKFKKVKLIMYTTCSVLQYENQEVVETAIESANRVMDNQRNLTMAHAVFNRKPSRFFTETLFEYVDLHEILSEYPALDFEGPYLSLNPNSACSGGFIALIRRKDVKMSIHRSTASSPALSSGTAVNVNQCTEQARPFTVNVSGFGKKSASGKNYPEEIAKIMEKQLAEATARPSTAPGLPTPRPDKLVSNRLVISVIPAPPNENKGAKSKAESKKSFLQRISVPTHSSLMKKKEKFIPTTGCDNTSGNTPRPSTAGRLTMPNGYVTPALDNHGPGCFCPRHARKFPGSAPPTA